MELRPWKSGSGNNGIEEVLHAPQIIKTRASPLDSIFFDPKPLGVNENYGVDDVNSVFKWVFIFFDLLL